MTPDEEKAALRREARALTHALSAEKRRAADAAIRQNVLKSEFYRRADCVFAYYGTGDEIDTIPLLRRILSDGKKLCLPRVGDGHFMEAAEVRSLSDLRPDRYGIPAPAPSAPAVAREKLALTLVPCLAATRDVFRLGHGGGYYDVFLAGYEGISLLLAREICVLPRLPLAPHDMPCTALITERVNIFP